MGIFSSLLLPLLETGAVVGSSFIPGAGPIIAPILSGAFAAGNSAMAGQGPLTSIASGAIKGGMQAGMGQLGDWMNASEKGVADTSRLGQNVSLAGPNMFGAGGSGDPLTDWAMRDLQQKLAQRNSFMIGGGGF